MVSALLAQLSFVHNVLCLFNPLYPLMGCLNCITKVGLLPVSERVAPPGVQHKPHGGCTIREDGLCSQTLPARSAVT